MQDFSSLDALLRARAEHVSTPTDERILDGALEAIAAYGPQRSTVDDIAEAAGVGRVTVFRRFGSKEKVLERLRLREVSAFLAEAAERMDAIADRGERVVEAFVLCVRTAQRHPWISRLIRTAPNRLVETLREGDPSPLQLGRMFVAERLRQDHPDAVATPGTDERLAELLIRLAFAYAVLPSDVVDFGDRAQLRAFAAEMILPILTSREDH